jgi:small GTP-binding protein
MGLKIGIIGLPNVGKSTLFNAIMGRQQALTAPYPFATVKPNIGVVDVPDERLAKLHAALEGNPRSGVTADTPIVHTSITFVDIAGLVKGAAEGQGLGNQFLSHIRDVDVIVHVLREFEDPDVPRHQDSKNPQHDAEIVETELGLKDLELKEKNPEYRDYLAKKPMMYAVNAGEKQMVSLPHGFMVNNETMKQWNNVFYFSAKIEEQISQLPKSEQQEFLAAYNLKESGLDRIIKQCYELLGLISFFTVGKIEVRAWPVTQGSTAPQAAAVIHSDFEKLFIRGEMIDWEKMCEAGSWQDAKEKGWVRIEGREYVVADGDVCNFLIGK